METNSVSEVPSVQNNPFVVQTPGSDQFILTAKILGNRRLLMQVHEGK